MKKNTKTVKGELIFGVHPIIECLKAKKRKLISIYTTKPEPAAFAQIARLMPKYPVAIQYVSRDILHKMAGSTDHQGIIAWVHAFPFRKTMFDPQKQPFIVLLDGIQDPRNLGAIIRSAYCAGAQGVVLCQKSGAPLNAIAIKASAGLAEHSQILISPSAAAAAQDIKNAGYKIYTAVFDGESVTTCKFETPLCLVIGGEGFGISKPVMKLGVGVTIPQIQSGISYNASVAAGILLFHIGVKNRFI